jgi:hypothetical protein
MARGDRRADLRARIGLEDLEGRNLQSALVGGAAASASLIRPTAASASAYHTTVWGGSAEKIGPVTGDSAAVEGEFAATDEELAPTVDRKATPILF